MTVASAWKRIRLHFKCTNLVDLDTLSKSDPYVVLYEVTNGSRGAAIGQTEKIKNNLNPIFNTFIETTFQFESRQDLCVVVYDSDGKGPSGDDVCGEASFQLSHIICGRGGKKELPLTRNGQKSKGVIEVSFSEVGSGNNRDTIRLGLRGASLRRPHAFFGGVNGYYTISRLQPNGTKRIFHKSEVANGTKDPRWSISPSLVMREIIGNDESEPVLEIGLAHSGCGSMGMGVVKTSVAELKECLTNKKALQPRKAKDTSQSYGELYVDTLHFAQFPTFTQSLAAGWQINMALSIDFTGSNGDQREPHSLHYMDPRNPNQYVSATMSVGDILMEYDTDKKIPVFGFGAEFNGSYNTSHFFNVNMKSDPYVHGIQGALNAYGDFLPKAVFSGPTNFAPTILAVTHGAREAEPQHVYTVLLIITDGEISDMDATIDAIVEADDAPLSIVIVGVGSASFQSMNELDCDNGALTGRKRASRRDLVQFVPYRDFAPPLPRHALAAEVLREVPTQFEEYLTLAASRLGAIPQPPLPPAGVTSPAATAAPPQPANTEAPPAQPPQPQAQPQPAQTQPQTHQQPTEPIV